MKLRAMAHELEELAPLIEQTEQWAARAPDEFAPRLTLRSLQDRRAQLEAALIGTLCAEGPPVDAHLPVSSETAAALPATQWATEAWRALIKGSRDGALSPEDVLVFLLCASQGASLSDAAQALAQPYPATAERMQRVLGYLVERTDLFRNLMARVA